MKNETIDAALRIAFEAGRWLGQVDLEKYYDREQYSKVMFESFISRKTTMPLESQSDGKTVKVNLRSEEWRLGVLKSSKEYLTKAKLILKDEQIHR